MNVFLKLDPDQVESMGIIELVKSSYNQQSNQ
jgi:hypothetical protein